ncbi:MAG: hypothetical protein FJX97_00305 [Bacteroidetes bacterium]|nr:hypothetical protein [Bacteroidota bacterium]
MTAQINGNYLEKYATSYAELVCDQFFSTRQFITGQEIIQLTPSSQVNFFIIKRLFELWQDELGKLKASPYFDYRDIAVHEALTQFMNVLSRRIKVERRHLEGMLQDAVQDAIRVATNPVLFYQQEVEKAPAGKINEYLKENKKYFKWNERLVTSLIDKAGIVQDLGTYQQAISANFQTVGASLDSPKELLTSISATLLFDLDLYLGNEVADLSEIEEEEVIFEAPESETVVESNEDVYEEPIAEFDEQEEFVQEEISFSQPEKVVTPAFKPVPSGQGLDAARLKALFATETYKGMKGILGELAESLALNQRFMFTRELFDGNADLLRHALKSVDELHTFEEAVDLINARFVFELGWDIESEEVREFMQQVYRKFVR